MVFSLLGKFSKSHNATKELFTKTGKKLLFPANTRWSSLHITYSRLLEIFDDVNAIASSKKWSELSQAERETIRLLCDIVEPFRGFTDRLQCESRPTLSLLYPGILNLINILKVIFFIFLISNVVTQIILFDNTQFVVDYI